MREYVATAKTVEEAIQLGCEALSVDRDDLGVSYEILEMPQKTGFLGLKVTPAKVKVTVETADTEPTARRFRCAARVASIAAADRTATNFFMVKAPFYHSHLRYIGGLFPAVPGRAISLPGAIAPAWW